ncbi:MAG TPA: alpha/beta hydrolase [Flavisolibacter sp.]|nr:alpha/beta hydrolase [Flavisolibacter sp.]
MNVYFISGLGADERAFERIRLTGDYSIYHLRWIAPLKDEPLNSYAKRLSAPIDTTQPFALVGLSMGGMIAAAMSDFLQPQKTILISSAACAAQLPAYFKWCGRAGLHKLIPTRLTNKPNVIAYWLFGAKSETEKKLLRRIITEGDTAFVKWGIGAILTWRRKQKADNIFHIHGEADKILPLRFTKPDVVVRGGSHFMVWTKAGEVSRLLQKILDSCRVASKFNQESG